MRELASGRGERWSEVKSREGELRVTVDGVSLRKRFRDEMRDGRNGKTLGKLRENLGLR